MFVGEFYSILDAFRFHPSGVFATEGINNNSSSSNNALRLCVCALVVAQGGVLSLVPSYSGCSATVSAGNGQVSGTVAARTFPSAGSPVGPTMDLYTTAAPAEPIGYVPAAAGTQIAYPAGITVLSLCVADELK